MKKTSRAMILMAGAGLAGPAGAAWIGQAEFGFSNTTGNTQTTTVNAKVDLDRTIGQLRHNLFGDTYYAQNAGVKSAERYLAGYKPSYFFTEKNYLFGMLRYDRDKFSFISGRFNEVVGYGRELLNNDFNTLDTEIGAGARDTNYVSDPSTRGLPRHDYILFLSLKYNANLTKTTTFLETARIEASEVNNFVQSETGFTMQVIGNLSTKVSYTMRYNSNITGARGQNIDTLTSVNLIYSFQ